MVATDSSGVEGVGGGVLADSSVVEDADEDIGRATRTASFDAETEMEGSDEGNTVTDSARHDPANE